MTRALWATFVTTAALVAIALGIALGVGAPDPGVIERAAAGAFGLLGLGAGSVAVSAAVEGGLPARPRLRRPVEEPSDAGTAGLVALERSLRFGASTAGDFYAQVRPRLVLLARSCFAREGVALSDKERSVELLGIDAYALVDPDGGRLAAPGTRACREVKLSGRSRISGVTLSVFATSAVAAWALAHATATLARPLPWPASPA